MSLLIETREKNVEQQNEREGSEWRRNERDLKIQYGAETSRLQIRNIY